MFTKKTHTRMFIASLFIKLQTGNIPFKETKQTNSYVHILEYYSATKRKTLLMHRATQIIFKRLC